jgi:hypothetical protein
MIRDRFMALTKYFHIINHATYMLEKGLLGYNKLWQIK